MRSMQGGINWNWFYADSYEDALAYYIELTGYAPKYDDTIQQDKDGRWSFRLHK